MSTRSRLLGEVDAVEAARHGATSWQWRKSEICRTVNKAFARGDTELKLAWKRLLPKAITAYGAESTKHEQPQLFRAPSSASAKEVSLVRRTARTKPAIRTWRNNLRGDVYPLRTPHVNHPRVGQVCSPEIAPPCARSLLQPHRPRDKRRQAEAASLCISKGEMITAFRLCNATSPLGVCGSWELSAMAQVLESETVLLVGSSLKIR